MTANDQAYRIPGSRTGILLIHAPTRSPSELYAIANGLARTGSTILCPRLTSQSGALNACEAALNELLTTCDAVIVVGASTSATLGLELAAKHPGKVAGLVLLAPVISPESGRTPWVASFLTCLPSRNLRTLVKAINQPTLIIQDRSGGDMSFHNAAYLQHNLSGTVDVAVLDGTRQNDLLIERNLNFIDRVARKLIKPAQQVPPQQTPAKARWWSWLPSLQPVAA
jgi:hypothetical protein